MAIREHPRRSWWDSCSRKVGRRSRDTLFDVLEEQSDACTSHRDHSAHSEFYALPGWARLSDISDSVRRHSPPITQTSGVVVGGVQEQTPQSRANEADVRPCVYAPRGHRNRDTWQSSGPHAYRASMRT